MANILEKSKDTLENENIKKDYDLDPRIHDELEKLNNCTDNINKLEMELDEANSTFRILSSESVKRLKAHARKLGSCIERARPYYDALDLAKQAQCQCQAAAVKFQRANEIHQAAKETVALAEQRFLSNQHEWKFDSAWQDMLNNAIMKVTDAEHQKAESGREHQRRTTLFHASEQKVQILEQRFRRHINKSRPYFEEKSRCEDQLNKQREHVLKLRAAVTKAKKDYACSLRRLEDISEEIHLKRRRSEQKSRSASPCGPREPGVGAEVTDKPSPELPRMISDSTLRMLPAGSSNMAATRSPSLDLDFDLEHCDVRSTGSGSVASSSILSDTEDLEEDLHHVEDLEELRQKVKELATKPVEEPAFIDGKTDRKDWETKLNVAVQKLDDVLHLYECEQELQHPTDNNSN